ncbi:MAG: hypothetical protein ACI85K_001455 [Hyphomicrobiaceae bacterium]|jgi:hypothetical protein
MKLVTNFALLTLLLMTPACETLGKVVQSININALLGTITNAQSATDAKPALDSVVAQLGNALAGAKAEGEGAAAEGGGMVETVLTQFGISPETTGTINTLLANPAVEGVLGATLNQLMGMISG